MTEKEIAEIRRRINIDKCSITNIRGCYVGEKGEIISDFDQFLGTVPKSEAEELLKIMKKTLSGQPQKNLIGIEFTNDQVVDSDEHRLLMTLRDTELGDDEAVNELFKKIIAGVSMEGKYIILLTLDKYDVPVYTKDDVKLEDCENIFRYLLCSICPVKLTKPALGYEISEQSFKNIKTDWAIGNPETGFMFPAFDDRQANIYEALYYVKDSSARYDELVESIFGAEIPMPADEQKEVFSAIIQETVSEDCDYTVMQNVHNQISQIVEEYKNHKDEPPVTISKKTVTDVFSYCGVPTERIENFKSEYDRTFGENARISPKNVVDVKKFEVKTPDVTIKVNPERADLVKTRIIDGQKYIMIRAEGEVEVNGVNINIKE